MANNPHVIILGAGPAGLSAASQLVRRTKFQVTVLERNGWVGGNAASFDLAGMRVDYGSHRLHPSCDPNILADIRAMLGDDLLDRPRHGRIRLRGRWIHFPLKPIDLALRLPPGFTLGVATDMAVRVVPRSDDLGGSETFASVMEKGLGHTICRDFYFPYARKLWGLDPGELSAVQARRRVSGGSLAKIVRKVLSEMSGRKTQGSGRFFYPLSGFGGISEAYYMDALDKRANFYLNAVAESLHIGEEGGFSVYYEREGRHHTLQADHVWSTIPINVLAGMMQPSPPAEVIDAAGNIDFRAMLLVYLVLDMGKFSEYDAHYFPEETIKISRLSEPKNYSGVRQPEDRTVLCAELPCSPDSPEWSKSDEELGDLVRDSLATAGIPLDATVLQVYVRRLRYAYPIYTRGYEESFDKLDEWIGHIPHLLTFGRQGLFAHDNTHHAIYMAYCAVDCFNEDGVFDREGWGRYRKIFETHVVED